LLEEKTIQYNRPEFITTDRIPKNQSGKILRRVLKAYYEGEDPGDVSTMESESILQKSGKWAKLMPAFKASDLPPFSLSIMVRFG